jgi:thiosulfate dehydrogenase [quinone] large subunit
MTSVSFLLLRIAVGMSMFGHGLVRLPKLEIFSNWMLSQFEKSMLPVSLVKPFSYFLPIAEFTIGLFLIFGLFTKHTLIAGSIVMTALIFGTSMIENWDAIPSQLFHSVIFCWLLDCIKMNNYSLDFKIFKKNEL